MLDKVGGGGLDDWEVKIADFVVLLGKDTKMVPGIKLTLDACYFAEFSQKTVGNTKNTGRWLSIVHGKVESTSDIDTEKCVSAPYTAKSAGAK